MRLQRSVIQVSKNACTAFQHGGVHSMSCPFKRLHSRKDANGAGIFTTPRNPPISWQDVEHIGECSAREWTKKTRLLAGYNLLLVNSLLATSLLWWIRSRSPAIFHSASS